MRVSGLDHIVLRTSDVERQLAFWTGELGLEALRVDQWRRGEVGFPSVRIDEGTIIDLFPGERDGTNVDHVCLVVMDVDVDELAASARFTVLDGPVDRWGARGTGRSIYINDPDGNVVELRTYPPRS